MGELNDYCHCCSARLPVGWFSHKCVVCPGETCPECLKCPSHCVHRAPWYGVEVQEVGGALRVLEPAQREPVATFEASEDAPRTTCPGCHYQYAYVKEIGLNVGYKPGAKPGSVRRLPGLLPVCPSCGTFSDDAA